MSTISTITTTEQPSTSTRVIEAKTTTNFIETSSKESKLSMKENIKPVTTTTTTISPSQVENVSNISFVAPTFDISANENTKMIDEGEVIHEHTSRNIQTRLYGAKQLVCFFL